MPVRAGLPAAISHCCTDEKSILGTADIPFPLQQPPKPAAEPGSTWMEVAEPSVPLQLFLSIKAVERSKTSSVFVGCTRRRAPGTAPASPHARLLRQAARGGLGWLKHRTAVGLAPSGSFLGSGSAGRRGSGCSEPSVVQHGGAASLLLAPRSPGDAAAKGSRGGSTKPLQEEAAPLGQNPTRAVP